MGIIRDLLGARRHERLIAESEQGSGGGRGRGGGGGRHAAPDSMCTFTWTTRVALLSGGGTRRHQCGNAIVDKLARRCAGAHLCRSFTCPDPVYSAATGTET